MFFKQLPTKESSLSYFFGCAGHAIAAAVDQRLPRAIPDRRAGWPQHDTAPARHGTAQRGAARESRCSATAGYSAAAIAGERFSQSIWEP